MTRGLRTTAGPIDGFRAFVEGRGAVFCEPKEASGEILRFKIGIARGYVARRKNGFLTFAGIARTLHRTFTGDAPETLKPTRRAKREIASDALPFESSST